MAANTNPIYTRTPDIQWIGPVTAGNTTRDLTTGTSYQIFLADINEGGFVGYVNSCPLGTNVQTVIRLWLNNGLTTATAANNSLIGEFTAPATTASETLALPPLAFPLDMAIPAGYRLFATLGTSVAAGFSLAAIAGKY